MGAVSRGWTLKAVEMMHCKDPQFDVKHLGKKVASTIFFPNFILDHSVQEYEFQAAQLDVELLGVCTSQTVYAVYFPCVYLIILSL